MKTLFYNALKANNREVCENLVLLALLDPEKYCTAIAGTTDFDSSIDWQKNLLSDIRVFPHWHETESSYAVEDFSKLLWLLRRSSPWGQNLETFRAVVGTRGCSRADLNKRFAVFESEGIKAVLHHLAQLRNRETRKPGGLWSALVSDGDHISLLASRIEKTVDRIKNLLGYDGEMNRDELLSALKELDECGISITGQLEKLFTNPIDAKMRIMELSAQRWLASRIDVRFNIADDQPGILITVEDLVHCICHIVDNAHDCVFEFDKEFKANSENFWIEFSFRGYTPERLGAQLVIRDNLPWKEKVVPRGGMKQFVEYCRKYAAIYDFTPETSDTNQRIRVIYRVDDKRLRHEYNREDFDNRE